MESYCSPLVTQDVGIKKENSRYLWVLILVYQYSSATLHKKGEA